MKKSPYPRRLIMILAIVTIILTIIDVVIHHHCGAPFLPTFAPFIAISLTGGGLFILIALCLSPLLNRREDYYDR
ncbi:MAG: hypothetical protein U9R29_09635 [Thermodesulfobacteriota bacterium]|nr:hypothetical protein [Thermodesulfobacteriota bacterium]